MPTKTLQEELEELKIAKQKSIDYLESYDMPKRKADRIKQQISKIIDKMNVVLNKIDKQATEGQSHGR